VSGKTNISHKEAWVNEAKLKVQLDTSIGAPFRYPILSLVHHSTAPLEHLVESASATLYSQFYLGEEVIAEIGGSNEL